MSKNKELLTLIDQYLQKNSLYERLKDIEESEFTFKIASYLVDNPKATKMMIGDEEVDITMDLDTAKSIVAKNESNLQKIDEKRKKKKGSGKITDYQSTKYGMKKKGKSPREKAQRIINKKLSQGKKLTKADYKRRDDAEKKEREKPGFKNTPRPDSKSAMTENNIERGNMLNRRQVRELLNEIFLDIIEEKKRRKKRKKKRKSKSKKKKTSSKTLSKKTKETLRKKARAKGYTPGSVYTEYRKGLGAYYSSGSRKGMSAHQWAMARVNSALQGGKSWATVKKSKAKKS